MSSGWTDTSDMNSAVYECVRGMQLSELASTDIYQGTPTPKFIKTMCNNIVVEVKSIDRLTSKDKEGSMKKPVILHLFEISRIPLIISNYIDHDIAQDVAYGKGRHADAYSSIFRGDELPVRDIILRCTSVLKKNASRIHINKNREKIISANTLLFQASFYAFSEIAEL